jgi:hypothetical protein
MRSALAFVIVSSLLAVSGCGSSSTLSPTSPSPSNTSGGVATGATISGTVNGPSTARAVSRPMDTTPLTVQVTGTNISVTVGPNGEFTITGVAPGNVELRFTGNGTNAKVTIRDVQTNEKIQVRITVNGSVAVIDSETRSNDDHTKAEVNGVIDGLTGTAAAFQFNVGSRSVHGDAHTTFFGDGDKPDTFADLKNGVRVEVKGRQQDGFVYAERIHINGTDEEEDEAEVSGRIDAVGGNAPDLTLTVGSKTVHTNGGTVVKRHGDVQPLSALAVGQTVEAEGTLRNDGSLDAKRISIEDDEDDGPFEIEGTLAGKSGSCPAVSFNVNGFGVFTDGNTTFKETPCSDLRNGAKVEVKGTRQADGRVKASSVEQKKK